MAVNKFLVATDRGLLVYGIESGKWEVLRKELDHTRVTCVSSNGNTIVAGTRRGVYRSGDSGGSWSQSSEGIGEPIIRWVIHHPQQTERVLVGTEPAGIFVSRDSGLTWRECEEVRQMRQKYRWSLPYSPEAGCVRAFTFNGERGYAAAEVGGVLRSDDYGDRWYLLDSDSDRIKEFNSGSTKVNSDVHSIQTHETNENLVYAPTGGGFYRSIDGGESWVLHYSCYCRAVWVDPINPDHMILGPADSVDRGGRIERSRDGGKTWMDESNDMDTPWTRHMVERFYQDGEKIFAVLSNGELICADLGDLRWKEVLSNMGRINAVISLTGLR